MCGAAERSAYCADCIRRLPLLLPAAAQDPSTDLEMRELILMFLANVSRDEKGASTLMQEGEDVEGLHVRRLLHYFTTPVSAQQAANKSAPDPNAYCAHILTNISQIAAG